MIKNQGIILFDGYCVLCSYFIGMIIRKADKSMNIVPMQSEAGQDLLQKQLLSLSPNEVILICEDKTYKGADAIIHLMRSINGWMSVAGTIAAILPRGLRNILYRLVANNRYQWFGKRNSCYIPPSNGRI